MEAMGSGLSSREWRAEIGALMAGLAQALHFLSSALSPQKSPKLKTLCTPYSPEHPHSILLVAVPKTHFAMTLGLPDGQSQHYEYSQKNGGDNYFICPDTHEHHYWLSHMLPTCEFSPRKFPITRGSWTAVA